MNILKFAAIAAASVLLSSCVVVEEGPQRPHPPRPDRPQACTLEYMPVCGVRGNQERTFANRCGAQSSGFRVIHQGQCRVSDSRPIPSQPPVSGSRPTPSHPPVSGSRPTPSQPPVSRPQRPDRQNMACTRDYRPVCASQRGDRRTFPNACEAERANYRIIRPGQC